MWPESALPTPPEAGPRERLLAAVLAYVAERGVSDLRLREVAAAVGTSHRMLIYHFGSREGLMVAIVRAVEAAQRAFLAELAADPSVSEADAIRLMWRRLAEPALWPNERLFFEIYALALQGRPGTAGLLDDVVSAWVELAADPHVSEADAIRLMWRRLADPALWPNERLFFEIYALALQGRPGTAGLLDDVVSAWVEPAAGWAMGRGRSAEAARADARLGVAVMRGLLLDLLATGDRAAVDAAVERFARLYEAPGACTNRSAG
jgi:AcrR family transcriptional regulator